MKLFSGKKNFVIHAVFAILVFFSVSEFAFSQTDSSFSDYISASVSQRQAALRCAINAKKFIEDENYHAALYSSEMGLAYDDSISDLWYEKAFAMKKLAGLEAGRLITVVADDGTVLPADRTEICNCAKMAYELNDWSFITVEMGKILYAQSLVDTNKAELAYKILESSFSSDVEYIRCQACYSMNDVVKARSIIASASRVFPNDERFPYIFFKTEFFSSFFKDKTPENSVFEIAAQFLPKIQVYQKDYPDILFYASFFANKTSQNKQLSEHDRLLRQYFSEKKLVPESIATGVKEGLLTQSQAANYFIQFCENAMLQQIFEKTLSVFTERDVVLLIIRYLSSFEGVLLDDLNENSYIDLVIQYKAGRPNKIFVDLNEDTSSDYYFDCEFGFPISARIEKNDIKIEFDSYPYIKKTTIGNDISFFFTNNSFAWQSIEFVERNLFDGFSFCFVNLLSRKIPVFENKNYHELLPYCYSITQVFHAEDGLKEKNFTIKDGVPIEILYIIDGKVYGKAAFQNGVLTQRMLDMDFDSFFEVTEFFKFDEKKYTEYASEQLSDLLYQELFGNIHAAKGLYPYKIAYDYDGNGIFECVDEFFTDGSKITWYEGFNEVSSYEKHVNDGVTKETFVLHFEKEKITMESVDGVPVKLRDSLEEKKIVFDKENNIYYIGEMPSDFLRSMVADKIKEYPGEKFFRTVLPYNETNVMILRLGGLVFAQFFD